MTFETDTKSASITIRLAPKVNTIRLALKVNLPPLVRVKLLVEGYISRVSLLRTPSGETGPF